jgi:glycosyltransferase involved in cell wall biosynthesis
MRILVVSQITSRMIGGVPAETASLVRGLHERGHVVGLATDLPLPGAEAAEHFPITVPTGESLPAELRSVIGNFRPDLIHVMDLGPRGVLRSRQSLDSTPWVFTCHSVPPHERSVPYWHRSNFLQRLARGVRYSGKALAWRWMFLRRVVPQVIVHSDFVRRAVIGCGHPASRTALIGIADGSTEAPFRRGDLPACGPSPSIVTVGGIAYTKGYHDALLALVKVLRRYPGLRYSIVGEARDGSYVDFLRREIVRLGLAAHVEICISLPGSAKDALLRQADLYLQPSHEEGFCLSYIEAAKMVPRLVGTATGAISAMSAGDPHARVVAPRRPGELAAAIEALLSTPVSRDAVPKRRAVLADRFGKERYLDAHEALYTLVRGQHPVYAS